MANKEAPNSLLSDGVFRILDMVCVGPISGFMAKPGTYGADPLVSTYYDDVPVRNTDGSYNFDVTGANYSFNYTLGGSDQTGILGFQKVENIIPLSSNTRIANPPDGGGPFKPVIASFSSDTYPDADSIKVTVRVPALFGQDTEGNTNPFQIDYAVDISINNGAFVTVGTHTIAGKCTTAYQRTTAYQLPKSTPASAHYEWKVRVRRVSQNILSQRVANEIFVDSISVVSTSLYAYPNTVLVGTEVGSSQFSNLPTRSYEIAGLRVSVPSGMTPTQYGYNTTPFTRQCDIVAGNKLLGFTTQTAAQADGVLAGMRLAGAGIPANAIVTSVSPGQGGGYFFSIDVDPTATATNVTVTFTPTETVQTITPAVYPSIWLGQFQTGVWTDNPAWIFYDLLTNNVHGLGDVVEASYADKWALYEISQYCDAMVDDGAGGLEPRFTCNVSIDQPQDAYSVLLNLASTFRGMLYYANGGIHASQQQDKSPVFAFNNSNVVNGVFSYSDTSRNTRSTVAKVKWVDPQNGYRESVEYVEDIDGILRYGYQQKEMTAFACTSRGQAYRLGSWTLETERLLTETVTFQTDLEGVALRPGDNFAVYDNFRNNRAQGGRILGWTPGRSMVTLDRSVAIEPNQVYSLSAIIPKAQFDGTGSITGSDQISLIRQSQVETFAVTTAATSGTSTLVIAGSFSAGLYAGSPFVLVTSGTTGSVFNRASFYTCLATAEVEPGKIEVLGLQANTGVQFSIQSGYTIVDWPTNSGDIATPILPPSNLFVTGITGMDANNTFYSSINLTWVNSPSANLSYYIVSGKEWDTPYERATVIDTGYNFLRGDTGQYLFKVAAVSLGGVESPFITGGFNVSSLNPLGTLRALSGVRLVDNGDALYVNQMTGFTGYVGINPGFSWTVPVDDAGRQIVDAQFISGYRWVAQTFAGVGLATGTTSGVDATSYQFTGGLLRNFASNPRGFEFVVQTVDVYGNLAAGGAIKVDNPPMKAPFASGFVGFNGGVIYNVTPSLQYDTSGIYLWVSQSPSFTPTYANYTASSSNLVGTVAAPQTGVFWTWFALGDTFAAAGNPIWGPISGNANQMFNSFDLDISAEINAALDSITGAFGLLTGMITAASNIFSGQDTLIVNTVNGLSGQIIGTTNGAVNTALTVRMDQITVNASGSLAQQIDAVRANTQLTGQQLTATVGTVSTALTQSGVALGSRVDVVTSNLTLSGSNLFTRVTATGASLLGTIATEKGALSEWITNLGAQTSGQSSSVQIGARAFVTGDVNGIGGAAVATWGFKLDSNGKVVSMQATSEDLFGHPTEYGTIAFGNANLRSNSFTAGSAGWQIRYDGSAEFNNISARGAFTGGVGSALVTANALGLTIGDPVGVRTFFGAGDGGLNVYINAANSQAIDLSHSVAGGITGGELILNTISSAGSASPTISLNGLNGSINCDTLDVDSTSNFDGIATHQAQVNITSTHKLHFSNAGTDVAYLKEDYGLNLYGDATHPIHVRGGSLVRAGTAGGSFGTQNILNFTIDFNPDTSWSDSILPNTFECATVAGADSVFAAYLKFRGPGGTTVYVPYRTTAP